MVIYVKNIKPAALHKTPLWVSPISPRKGESPLY